MSQPAEAGATRAETPPPDPKNASTGKLIGEGEVPQKAKRLGVGAGLFGGAGLVALANVLPGWPAAVVVAVVLFAVAGAQADVETVKQAIAR